MMCCLEERNILCLIFSCVVRAARPLHAVFGQRLASLELQKHARERPPMTWFKDEGQTPIVRQVVHAGVHIFFLPPIVLHISHSGDRKEVEESLSRKLTIKQDDKLQ